MTTNKRLLFSLPRGDIQIVHSQSEPKHQHSTSESRHFSRRIHQMLLGFHASVHGARSMRQHSTSTCSFSSSLSVLRFAAHSHGSLTACLRTASSRPYNHALPQEILHKKEEWERQAPECRNEMFAQIFPSTPTGSVTLLTRILHILFHYLHVTWLLHALDIVKTEFCRCSCIHSNHQWTNFQPAPVGSKQPIADSHPLRDTVSRILSTYRQWE